MSASQFASLLPETVGASESETTVLLDTGSISGNLLVLAASLAEGQRQSRSQLNQMTGHLQAMSGHVKSLADGSTQFNAALGIKPGEPATPPTFMTTIQDQSIDKMVTSLTSTFQPRFDEQAAATAALHLRVERLAERVEDLCKPQLGEETVTEVVAAVTRDRMGELHAVVEELRVQVRELVAGGGPGGHRGSEPLPPPPANRRRNP